MHYTFDAFRICSIRCWGKERMQHFMNAVIMHQNGGYNNAGAFRRSCIIIHFVELHLLHTAFTKIWCAFSYVLHSAALRCSSRFTLDALRTLPISGSTADLPLPFWPVVLTHTHRQCSLSSVHPCRKPLWLSVVVSSTRRRLTPLSCSVPPPTTWWSRIQSSPSSALLLTRTTISWLKGCWPFSFVLHRVDIEWFDQMQPNIMQQNV